MKQKQTKSLKAEHELSLLPSKALISMKYYLDYEEYEHAKESLNEVFRQYRYNYDDVITAIKKAYFYITKDRYNENIPSRNTPEPKQSSIEIMKKDVNELRKKYQPHQPKSEV